MERLSDPDWGVRAGATQALIAAGPGSVEWVKPLMQSSHHSARVAAVHILTELGEQEWLKQTLPKL